MASKKQEEAAGKTTDKKGRLILENEVCYTGCKMPEIERNGIVVVPGRTTPADRPSKF